MRRAGRPSYERRNNAKPNSRARACIKMIVEEACDGVCHLCRGDVDPTLSWPHPQSGVLDHFPTSFADGGAYVVGNLMLAHKACNEVRI